MKWRLLLSPKAQETLKTLSPETKNYLRAALQEIAQDPWAGKPLKDDLAGFHSFRAKRFRVVYEIQHHVIRILVVGIGHRREIYEQLSAEYRK